jgi:hypothetical protein
MPTKLPHNCEACSRLSAPQAREKKCWEDKRCPDRRSYHRKKAATAIRRKEQRQNAAIDSIVNADGLSFDLAIPDTYAAELCLWINRSNNTIHAIGARLHRGSAISHRTNVVHCLPLTSAQLDKVVRDILVEMSAVANVSLSKFRVSRVFDASLCPLTDCHVY